MRLEHLAAVIGLICGVAYFTERLGLADLPGIPNDYMAVAALALIVGSMARRTGGRSGAAGNHG